MASDDEHDPLEGNEQFFDELDPLGGEFELPDISSPMKSLVIDISRNWFIPQDYHQLDSLIALDTAFISDISNPLSMDTHASMLPIVKTESHFSGSANVLGFETNRAHPLQKKHIPLPASASSSPKRKQQFDTVDSENSSKSCKFSSHQENKQTPALGYFNTSRSIPNTWKTISRQLSGIFSSLKTFSFSSKDCNANNHVSICISGCTSASGSNVSAGNQQIRSSWSSDLLNKLAYGLVEVDPPGFGSNVSLGQNYLNLLKKTVELGIIELNVIDSQRKQLANSNSAPLTNSNDSTQINFDGSYDLTRMNSDGSYTCNECNMVFPGYHAFGAHKSYHIREGNLDMKLASQLAASNAESSSTSYGARGSKNTTEETDTLSKSKCVSREVKAEEKFPPSDSIGKKESNLPSKRLSKDIYLESDAIENQLSPRRKALKVESSCDGNEVSKKK